MLPSIADNEWFFDTELLVLAERSGLRIHEVPVDWADDPDSRVHLAKTIAADLKGVWRLMRSPSGLDGHVGGLAMRRKRDETSEAARFASVGALSTLVYLALFLLLRLAVPAYAANLCALAVCSIGNLAAHHQITFSRVGPISRRALVVGACITLLTSISFTTGLLALARSIDPFSAIAEVAGLLVGNALAAFVRFAILRTVVYRTHLHVRSD
ncbi:MAG: GtrA family protein [Acidimicrobiaceae bacterium]|nr:GtrA family protein [Acidimicrobiaceae bacterium]